jgi:hypothetical protein
MEFLGRSSEKALPCMPDRSKVSCSVATGQAMVEAGLHPATGDGSLACSGELDFRGALGIERDSAVGPTAVRLHFDLTTSATPKEVADLVSTTERYSVVLQTLAGTPRIGVGSEIGSA